MSQPLVIVLLGAALLASGCGASASRALPGTGLDARDANDSEKDASVRDSGGPLEVGFEDTSPADSIMEGPPTADHPICQAACDVTDAIPCGDRRPNCVEECEVLLAGGVCTQERRAYLGCQIAATPPAFLCDRTGTKVLIPGICVAESDALLACFKRDAGTD
jgi:hypothetical protein